MSCTSQDVAAPIELSDRVHAAVKAQVGDRDIGCSSIWPDRYRTVSASSRSGGPRAATTAMVEILVPVIREALGAHGPPTVPPITAFEPRGLIVQAAGVDL